MITYVLVLFFHVGVMANSNAATTVTGFLTLQECQQAGGEAVSMVRGTVNKLSFVCVKQTH